MYMIPFIIGLTHAYSPATIPPLGEEASDGCAHVKSCVSCSYTYDALSHDAMESGPDDQCVKDSPAQLIARYNRQCHPAADCYCQVTLVWWAWSLIGVHRECVGEKDCSIAESAIGYGLTITTQRMCCEGDNCNTWSLMEMTHEILDGGGSGGTRSCVSTYMALILFLIVVWRT